MSSDIPWAPIATALRSAMNTTGGPEFAGEQLIDQLDLAGNYYDESYNRAVAVATAGTVGSVYATWLSEWSASFTQANKAIVFAGGASVGFSTDPAPISAALATAIAVMLAAPYKYGPDGVRDCQGLVASLHQLSGTMPPPPMSGPVPVVTGDRTAASQLQALMVRAQEYIAFLGGHP